jgi:hypothetical protein
LAGETLEPSLCVARTTQAAATSSRRNALYHPRPLAMTSVIRVTHHGHAWKYLVLRDDPRDRSQNRALRDTALAGSPFLPFPADIRNPPIVKVGPTRYNSRALRKTPKPTLFLSYGMLLNALTTSKDIANAIPSWEFSTQFFMQFPTPSKNLNAACLR